MALPTSGELSINDIYTEIYGLSIPAAGDSDVSLSNLAFQIGAPTDPDKISEFYGYSSFQPSWLLGYLGGSISYSNEGTQSYQINCQYKQDGQSYQSGSTYNASGSFTSRAPSVWQDIDNVSPSSFITNDNGTNRLYIYRSINAFNAATITVNLTPATVGSLTFPFSNISYSTTNGSVTSQTLNSSQIYLVMSTSASSLTYHAITIEFKM